LKCAAIRSWTTTRVKGSTKNPVWRELILSDDIPDPREVVLINLGNACRLLDDLFTPAEYEQVRSRITALARLDLIGQEMAKSIREIERTMAIAMSMTMMA